MSAILKVFQIPLSQSMHIYLRNIPVKCYRDRISNDEALSFFVRGCPQQQQQQQQQAQQQEQDE